MHIDDPREYMGVVCYESVRVCSSRLSVRNSNSSQIVSQWPLINPIYIHLLREITYCT